jgi:hypothetical protein
MGQTVRAGTVVQTVDVPYRMAFMWDQVHHILFGDLGEAHRGLSDQASANASYLATVNTGLDTHYVHLAQARLRSILT